ncbi:hypothetical protein BD310DRAFT_83279 [Dichomitus squalens]|uniref:Uncharacterized protein n=1 Tax=Dichomitus squalens TaxID=114155 RepID=A0A4V6MWN8_9APHY|nr:hypothetical protein BD310DRAFT_83279 [Dichomitus squalens]
MTSRSCLIVADLIVADLIVVSVTWRAMYGQWKLLRQARQNASSSINSYSGVLLHDGMVYFLVLIPLGLMHMIFTLVSVSLQERRGKSPVCVLGLYMDSRYYPSVPRNLSAP